MRIISGKWKGRRFIAPNNLPTRPTTDFAKEALFNILNHQLYLDEIKVLDLFAGIGSISLEFASRGAVKVDAVEQNPICVDFINQSIEKIEAKEIEVFKHDVFQFLTRSLHDKYDVVFADPPYDLEEEDYNKIVTLIFENDYIEEDGMFILEHPKGISFEEHPKFSEHKKYGNVNFSFFYT